MAFGEVIAAADAGIAAIRERFLLLGEWCYQQRPVGFEPASRRSLLARPQKASAHAGFDRRLRSTAHSAAGIFWPPPSRLSRRIVNAVCPEPRIGIVLPAGKRSGHCQSRGRPGGRGRTVNLNFSAGRGARSNRRSASVKFGIALRPAPWRSASPIFPGRQSSLHLEDEMTALGRRASIFWRIILALTPSRLLLLRVLRIPRDRGSHLTKRWCSSPRAAPANRKGVVLSHRNILEERLAVRSHARSYAGGFDPWRISRSSTRSAAR